MQKGRVLDSTVAVAGLHGEDAAWEVDRAKLSYVINDGIWYRIELNSLEGDDFRKNFALLQMVGAHLQHLWLVHNGRVAWLKMRYFLGNE
jgi:hypothetical protein